MTPLRLLCIYMAMFSSQDLLAHILLWTGHFAINMWLSIFVLAVLPICFYIGANCGLTGVAVGWLIGFPLSNLPASCTSIAFFSAPGSTIGTRFDRR